MGKGLWAGCALALFALGGVAQAYVLREDSGGKPVRWGGDVVFVVDPGLPQQLGEPHALDAVAAAVESYRKALPEQTIRLEHSSMAGIGFDGEGSLSRNSIVMPKEWPFQPEAIAVTVVTVDDHSHAILDADIALNPSRTFRLLPPGGEPNGPDDIQNTLTHELGHAFGLAHNPDDPGAVMYPTATAGETLKRVLSEDDLAGLRALYDLPPPEGCASVPFGPWALLGVALFLVLRRRPKALPALCAVFALALPFAARAEPPQGPVLLAHVETIRTLPPANDGRPLLLMSEVVLKTDRCLQGSCPAQLVVRMPGGHFGHLTQFVEDDPLPGQGEVLGVVLEKAAPAAPLSLTQARVFALSRERDFACFAQLLELRRVELPRVPESRRP